MSGWLNIYNLFASLTDTTKVTYLGNTWPSSVPGRHVLQKTWLSFLHTPKKGPVTPDKAGCMTHVWRCNEENFTIKGDFRSIKSYQHNANTKYYVNVLTYRLPADLGSALPGLGCEPQSLLISKAMCQW